MHIVICLLLFDYVFGVNVCDTSGWTAWGPCSKSGMIERKAKIRCPKGVKPEVCLSFCNLTNSDVVQSKLGSNCSVAKGERGLLRKQYACFLMIVGIMISMVTVTCPGVIFYFDLASLYPTTFDVPCHTDKCMFI